MSMPKEFSVLSPDHEFKEVVRGVMWNKFFEKNGIVKKMFFFLAKKYIFEENLCDFLGCSQIWRWFFK
jgi:hypothetical protein